MIGSKDARTFLDRGSRLPDALIFSASRPIKHCTKHCPCRSPTQRRGRRPGPKRFRGLRLFGLVWPAAEQTFALWQRCSYQILRNFHERPALTLRFASSKLEARDSRLRPLPLSVRSGRRAGPASDSSARRESNDLPAKPSTRPSFTSSVLTAPGSCASASPARRCWDHGRCRTSSAAGSWLEDEPLPRNHAAIDPLDG